MTFDFAGKRKEGPLLRDFSEAGAKNKKSSIEQLMNPTMLNRSLHIDSIVPSGITICSGFSGSASVDSARARFPQFTKLPTEVRLMIWNAALPGPRVVDIWLLPLKQTQSQWDREHGIGLPNLLVWDNFVSGVAPGEHFNPDDDHLPDGRPALLGVKSQCQTPPLLLVNHEAHKVAAKHLQKAFSSHASVPETYFDFEVDTLYIQYHKFNLQIRHPAYALEDQNLVSCLRKLNMEDLKQVKKLAVRFYPGLQTHEVLEDEIAELLSVFTAVRHMTLVAEHYDGCTFRTNDKSPISLIEPIDIYDAFNSYSSSTIPDGVSAFQIPRPRPARKLASVILTNQKLGVAMNRKHRRMQAAMNEDDQAKSFSIFGKTLEIPTINVMVVISEAIKESPELFLTPLLHHLQSNPQFLPRVNQMRTGVTGGDFFRACGKMVRPGMYLHNFKDVVCPLSSSYLEMSWEKYLQLAQETFVEHSLKAMMQGLPWWL